MAYEAILYEKMDGWAKVTLNRPKVLNALSYQLLRELNQVLDDVEADDDVKVLVIAGAGSAFSAGADLKEVLARSGDVVALTQFSGTFIHTFTRFEELSKPVIAMLHGYVFAGGLELALGCDIVIAAEDAVIGDQHANFGLVPGGGNSQRIPRLMGLKRGLEFILTGEWISGKEAAERGLISKAVPRDKLEETVMALVDKLKGQSPVATRTIKRLVYQGSQVDLRTGLEMELQGAVSHFFTQDCQEGIKAFSEKRKPSFTGR